jgi:hypothetical protein
MLSKFNNEVLSKGPAAVLPQNLDHAWLNRLEKVSEDFLTRNFSIDECKTPQDVADPLLSVCVYEILSYHDVDRSMISTKDMIEKMAVYAISIVMEAVNRESDIGLEPPDLDNILSVERIVGFKKNNPELSDLLERACVFPGSGKG